MNTHRNIENEANTKIKANNIGQAKIKNNQTTKTDIITRIVRRRVIGSIVAALAQRN